MNRGRYYKWTLDADFVLDLSEYTDYIYEDVKTEWMTIINNVLTIKAGYSWDGCSPKKLICGVVVGTWDGPINPETEKQWCYYASLVHDVLYQYRCGKRSVADKIFYRMLYGFKLRGMYYRAVRMFGSRYWIYK